jgi:hypothetical protein
MKLFLVLLAVALIFSLSWADHKWRQWIAARRDHRNDEQKHDVK